MHAHTHAHTHTQLQELYLRKIGISSSTAKVFATCMIKNDSLLKLDLSDNNIGEVGVCVYVCLSIYFDMYR